MVGSEQVNHNVELPQNKILKDIWQNSSYIFHVFIYGNIDNPTATNAEKTNRLVDSLPKSLRAYFVRDTPKTVQDFTERLKLVAVEHAYTQGALVQAGLNPALLPSVGAQNALSAASKLGIAINPLMNGQISSLNSNLVGTSFKTAVPIYATLSENLLAQQSLAPQVKEATKDAKIESLEAALNELKYKQAHNRQIGLVNQSNHIYQSSNFDRDSSYQNGMTQRGNHQGQ